MSKVILVRHAAAVSREQAKAAGIADRKRPLTAQGIRGFRKQITKHRKIFGKVDLWVTSPFVRAKETLDVVFEVLGVDEAEINILPKLTPESKPAQLREWLKKRKEKTIVLVSHEPFLTDFISQNTVNVKKLPKIKKGAIVILDFNTKDQKYKLKALFIP